MGVSINLFIRVLTGAFIPALIAILINALYAAYKTNGRLSDLELAESTFDVGGLCLFALIGIATTAGVARWERVSLFLGGLLLQMYLVVVGPDMGHFSRFSGIWMMNAVGLSALAIATIRLEATAGKAEMHRRVWAIISDRSGLGLAMLAAVVAAGLVVLVRALGESVMVSLWLARVVHLFGIGTLDRLVGDTGQVGQVVAVILISAMALVMSRLLLVVTRGPMRT
jgi:hypothetical protein